MTSHIIDGKEFIETAEALKIAGRSESHLRLMARQGKLPCRKIFGRWAYDKEALTALASGMVIESKEASKEVKENETPTTEPTTTGGTELDL